MGPSKGSLFHDPLTQVVSQVFAVIYAPGGQRRDRFPENVVKVVETEEEARAQADPAKKMYAAVVNGPSRSSEGFRLYYLVRWLD